MADIPSGVLKPAKFGGLEKESVMTYLDELNTKIDDLEKQLAEREEAGGAQESNLIKEYRRDLEEAEKRASEAQKAADEAAGQLQSANDKAAQLAQALKSERDGRAADAQQMKQLLQQAQAKANSVDEGKMREY